MSGALRRWMSLALLGAAAAGCRMEAAREPSGPRLEARWTGSDTGSFSAPAVAEQCDSLDLLEIRAASGDTGLALAVYRRGAAEPGEYLILRPDAAETGAPAAAVALRWFSRTAVRGFRSDSGRLTLRRAADGALSGSFTAALHPAAGPGRLAVAGSFEDLRERPATRGCASRSATPDSAEGVD